MRAKVILSVSLLALILLAPAVYFRFKSSEPAPSVGPVASVDGTNTAPTVPAILHRIAGQTHASDSAPGRSDAAADLNSPEHQEYVNTRDAEICQMGVRKDADSLKTILAELHNPDPNIRQTALTAVMDIGSKDAIPTLKNEMAWAEDPEEKVAIQKAIKFLELPTLAMDANRRVIQ
jgi:hypothetical protein